MITRIVLLVLFGFFLIGWWLLSAIGAVTHGSIKAYEYPIPKDSLHAAVEKVIRTNPNIFREPQGENYIVDVTDGKNDTLYNDHYNDGKRYISIKIKTGGEISDYVFHFYGSDEYWQTSKTSQISIAYAYDKDGGGSEGNGGVPWYKPSLKKRLVTVFEKDLIEKIDRELGVSHVVAD